MSSYNQNAADTFGKVNNNITHSPSTSNLSRSLTSATTISSPVASPRRSFSQTQTSLPNGDDSPRTTLQRSPSSMSMYNRSTSSMGRSPSSMSMHSPAAPVLRTRTSMGSYHGVTPPRSRRTSPSPHNTAMPARSPLSTLDDVPVYTARGIASTHFISELEMHSDVTEQRPANTVVILHDACYGHRFSRPRTSKASLATIVERPERIQASVLGVSVAYVRLGGRHDEGWHPLHPKREASSLPSIPFRIRKTGRKLALASPAVVNVHGTKWMDELKGMCDTAEAKLATTGKELSRDSSKSADGIPGKLHEGDLYLCAESLEAMEGALGAVCEGVDAVFQGSAVEGGPSRAFVIVRPPGHHCSSSYPSGFCWLNNVHVGIQHAILNHGLTHAAIIDFDLHHGDGSQSIAWDHNTRASTAAKNSAAWKKTSIGYFSLHDINSYPCEMGDEEKIKNASLCIENAHGQNIWNIHLEAWKSEDEFWEIYESKYSVLLEKTRKFLRTQTEIRSSSTSAPPKAAIFFSAGFDASEWESDGMQRHKVNVPTEFYARLSRDVVKLSLEEGLNVDGRIISVLEGGYSDRALMTGVLSHISGLTGGDPVKDDAVRPGLAQEMGRRLSSVDGKTLANGFQPDSNPYDADWWSLPRLEQLDLVLNPHPVPAPYQPTRSTALGNFSSPTQSFIAKVVPHRRTSYGASIESVPRQAVARRISSPKPPDVDWATAAHELSKLLIPSDRQISSCKHEDLSAAATRDRKERQSILNLADNSDGASHPMGPPAQPTRMALRERKVAKYVDGEDEPYSRPASKAGRRKTSTGVAVLGGVNAPSHSTAPLQHPPELQQQMRKSRRQSVVSNVGSTVSEVPSTAVSGRGRVPSVTLNGHPRPDTAQSIRPESSMSMRGTAGGARKPVVKGRPEASKSTRVRKTAPAHNIPNVDGVPEVPRIPSALAFRNGSSKEAKADDSAMDDLTSGLGKIKLTLVTKAQREAKEKAKKQAEETDKPATNAARKPALPKAPRSSSVKPKPKSDQTEVPEQTQPPAFVKEEPLPPSTDSVQLPPHPVVSAAEELVQHTLEASQAPLPPSSPAEKPFTTPEKTLTGQTPPTPHILHSPESEVNGPAFIPYQPDGPAPNPVPHPQYQQQPESLTWLAPNTNTPAGIKVMKRNELPVFTSTSPIRFGVPSEHVPNNSGLGSSEIGEAKMQSENMAKPDKKFDDREIPETPDR